jgi:hypothetical protein
MQTPEDKYWCCEGCGFVKKNHRCEQWSQTIRIPKEAVAEIQAARDAEWQARVDRLEAALKEGEGITEKPQAQ